MNKIKSFVLISDADPQIRRMLKNALNGGEFKTEDAQTGKEACRLAASIKPNLMLLGMNYNDINGMEIIKRIREWSSMPIIVMSNSTDDGLAIEALENGADDYVLKPFNVQVLIARIHAALRRAIVEESSNTELSYGDIKINLLKHEVTIRGERLQLSPKEYNLLAYLISNRGKMLTHSQILNKVWGPSHSYDTQYLRVYIGQLRKKIDQHSKYGSCIVTEAGVGYMLDTLKAAA